MDQPLPDYQDHVTGHNMSPPSSSQQESAETVSQISHYVYPNNPSFGPPSTVKVPKFKIKETMVGDASIPHEGQQQGEQVDDAPVVGRVCRSDIPLTLTIGDSPIDLSNVLSNRSVPIPKNLMDKSLISSMLLI